MPEATPVGDNGAVFYQDNYAPCCSGASVTGYYWHRNSAVRAKRGSGSLGNKDGAECGSIVDRLKKGQYGMR